MESHYGLSEIEYEFMELFWNSSQPLPFSAIVEYCNTQKGHNWAQTTIHTYLTRLIQKGVLISIQNGRKLSYQASVTEGELSGIWAAKFVETSFGGSVKKFLLSLTQKTRLSKEEVQELQQILEEQAED